MRTTLPGAPHRNRSCDTSRRRFGVCSKRALAGHRRTVRALGLELAGQNLEHRIVTQFVMIVEVVLAQSQAHALADQGLDRVLEQPDPDDP